MADDLCGSLRGSHVGPQRAQRLGDDFRHAHRRIEAGERILEHDLHACAHVTQFFALGRSWMARPNHTISPLVTGPSRNIARVSVDLPQPDSPTTPNASPAATSSDTSSTACNSRDARNQPDRSV